MFLYGGHGYLRIQQHASILGSDAMQKLKDYIEIKYLQDFISNLFIGAQLDAIWNLN